MHKDEVKALQKKVVASVQFYRDCDTDTYFAKFKFRGHYEVHAVNSPFFTAFLNSSLRNICNKCGVADWSEVLTIEKENVLLNDDPVEVFKRIAGDENTVWYFLADKDWSCIRATKDGWSITCNYDKLFIKGKNTKSQVTPVSSRGKDKLRKYVNLSDRDYLLFKINVIHNFFYETSHYVGIISSGFGEGKTVLTRVWRKIVSPANAEVTLLASSVDDFKIQLANNDFVILDNCHALKGDFSDIVCGATGGSSFSLRQLYTDCTELILKVKCTFVMNGLDIVPRRQDLLSRCLLFETQPLTDDDRLSESKFWKSFDKDLPYILGDIFDTICVALQKLETLGDITFGRMADASREMLAIALALGISQEEFFDLLSENQEKLKLACSRENDLVQAILEYMEGTNTNAIEGNVSEVYGKIKDFKKSDLRGLPKSPSAFSRKVNEVKPLLLSSGVSVTSVVKKDATYMTITKN